MDLCFSMCLYKLLTCKCVVLLPCSILMVSFELGLPYGHGTSQLSPCIGSVKTGVSFTLLKPYRARLVCFVVMFICSHFVNNCIAVSF